MAFDLETIERRLTETLAVLSQAKADVEFLETAKRLLADPRALRLLEVEGDASQRRPYGEVKLNVLNALPAFGEAPITSGLIVNVLMSAGFIFTASHPINAVNESLRALEAEGKAKVVGRSGIAKLWTRESENPSPVELDPEDIDWSGVERDWLEDKDA